MNPCTYTQALEKQRRKCEGLAALSTESTLLQVAQVKKDLASAYERKERMLQRGLEKSKHG